MTYGTVKVNTITYKDGSNVDQTFSFSGAIQNGFTLISGASGIFTASLSGASITGTSIQATNITGVTIVGITTVSGATITGTSVQATNVTGVTVIGTTTVSGATITGTTGNFTNLNATTISGTISGYGALDTAQTWTKGQRGEITVLTDGATITADFADSNNFSVTLGGNRTLANPSNQTAGQSGSIWITQDGTGSRTLAYGSQWDFTGGTAPTLSTAAASVDCLVYAVQSSTKITATLINNLS